MNILVTYQSKTGFTAKYAKWIADELKAELREISRVSEKDVQSRDLVVHGGWIMGGMINGLTKIRKLAPKKLIVFGVGFTKKEDIKPEEYQNANKLNDTPFFIYEGGLDPKKMGFVGRAVVKAVTKQTPQYVDRTDKNEIGELVKLAAAYTSEV